MADATITEHHYIDTELPPLSQQILRLRYQQGLKYREIAETLKVGDIGTLQLQPAEYTISGITVKGHVPQYQMGDEGTV